ncbi:MAG: hypothetical protein R3F59_26095 [Myxococcota bacterium]
MLGGALRVALVVGGIALLCAIVQEDVGRDLTEAIKIPLAAAASVLAACWGVRHAAWQRLRGQVLVFLVLVGGANYARWGFSAATERLDAYDLLHYYINAKYFDELGYYDLYPAMMVVDQEAGPFFQEPPTFLAQSDEAGHQLQPLAQGLRRGRVVREGFTEARWDAFAHDVLYLQRTVGCTVRSRRTHRCVRELNDDLWMQLLNDHGYNGTTAWTLLARPLTWVPVEYVKVLGYADVVLLVGALCLVGAAYGSTAALWTTLFLFVTYSTRWPYFSWALLRYDWVALLIATPAVLRLRMPLLGGFFAGTAALLRLFPALYMWGPLCKGVVLLVTERRARRALLWMASGFLLAVFLVQGAATLRFGVGEVATHFENMEDHNKSLQLSSRRIGLALALATEPWRGEKMEPIIDEARKQRIEDERWLRYAVGGALLLLLGLGVSRRGDDEAYAYGFLPFFFLTTASYYYYVARVPLIVAHAGHLERSTRDQVLLAVLFAIEAGTNAVTTIDERHRLVLISWLAWDLLLYAVVAVGWMLLDPGPVDLDEADPQV